MYKRQGDGHGAVTVKRQAAGEHFIQHNTDSVDVGAGIGAFSLGLLRADIVYRADSLVADGLAPVSYTHLVEAGTISKTRYASYLAMYEEANARKEWEK